MNVLSLLWGLLFMQVQVQHAFHQSDLMPCAFPRAPPLKGCDKFNQDGLDLHSEL